MTTSVGMKARKKQSISSRPAALSDSGVERALTALEAACVRILDDMTYSVSGDPDQQYWQQCFKNVATPISLALAEFKGPRQFHYHYKHSEKDDAVLTPVLEDPVEMLAHVCERALNQCEKKLVGIRDRDLIGSQRQLESALRTFLFAYEKYQEKTDA